MKGTSREIFLERVRKALGRREGAAPDRVSLDHNIIRRPLPSVKDELASLIDQFSSRARAVGMSVKRCGRAEVSKVLADWIESEKLSTVLLPEDPCLDSDLRDHLTRQKINICSPDVDLDTLYDQVDCGVTVASAAVAATGSVVLTSSENESRLASLVPPRHLVLVPCSVLVEDLLDLSGDDGVLQCGATGIPSSVTLVTGPSKTADIEGVLVTGVHGPGTVQIVLVTD
ncbi:MAG: LUD domain-containing protein [Planctomycetota bacterium]|nr:LUD domain-containing protein [Planctomycetota bacterium]